MCEWPQNQQTGLFVLYLLLTSCWLVVQVRDKVYSMRDTLDPYNIQLGFAIDAVSALRGTVSAAASDADNYSDQGITIGVNGSHSNAAMLVAVQSVM